MAHIHGISHCTRFLLNGTRPVNGKQFETFGDIIHFWNNHEEIAAGAEAEAGKWQDHMIAGLRHQEVQLERQIAEGIERRTEEVRRDIGEITRKREASGNVFLKSWYALQAWGARQLSSYRINRPSMEDRNRLGQLRYEIGQAIVNRPSAIRQACENVRGNYRFLEENKNALAGARGEEEVIQSLSGLPDTYHVLNDVNLYFTQPVRWRHHDAIEHSQIDHVVLGPTGIWLLETKNWKPSGTKDRAQDLFYQITRADFALQYYLKPRYPKDRMPLIQKILVTRHGIHQDQMFDPDIRVLPPGELCDYIIKSAIRLSEAEVLGLVRIIPCREVR